MQVEAVSRIRLDDLRRAAERYIDPDATVTLILSPKIK